MRGKDKKLRIDITGKKTGKLTVIKFSYNKNQSNYWECLCECGKTILASTARINYDLQSCGCILKEKNVKHGFYNHPLYKVYRGMLYRCYNTKSKWFHLYGGMGVIVCDEWINNPKSFYDWALSNGYIKGLQIDRFPNKNGNYEPINCRWATPKENSNNTRDNVILTFNGLSLTISEWSEKLNIPAVKIRNRYYKRKFTIDKILNPNKNVNKNRKKFNNAILS